MYSIILCPNCGGIANYNYYFQEYICEKCYFKIKAELPCEDNTNISEINGANKADQSDDDEYGNALDFLLNAIEGYNNKS